ncbi:MAG TPA: methyl-accepting chemotaxis protein [Solirubrobacteraceae bacterium]|nr:methyl-accepting chemotaxis protein [Solirubrobacteraceae bacterium]
MSGPADRKAMADFEAAWATYPDATAAVADVPAGDMRALDQVLSSGDGDVAWEALEESLAAWDTTNDKSAAADKAQARDVAASTRTLTIVLLLVGIAGAAVVAAVIVRGISRGMRQLVGAARGIAEGDVEQDLSVRSRDEIGDAVAAFRDMVDYLRESVAAADRIAAGDLTADVQPRSERDALGHALQGMTTSLRAAIGDVAGSAASVSAASEQMAGTADEAGRAVGEIAMAMGDIATGAERQVQSVHTARETFAGVRDGVAASARTARETAEAADEARTIAEQGVTAAVEASEAMTALRTASADVSDAIRSLGAKSHEIGGIVDTITGIAEQTNLLALNAAIEAARAGEQGRGFAVVAEEVRKLAEESQDAAGRIAGLIGEIQTETQNVVGVVEDTAVRTESGAATVDEARAASSRWARRSRTWAGASPASPSSSRTSPAAPRYERRHRRGRRSRRALVRGHRAGLRVRTADLGLHAGDRRFLDDPRAHRRGARADRQPLPAGDRPVGPLKQE